MRIATAVIVKKLGKTIFNRIKKGFMKDRITKEA